MYSVMNSPKEKCLIIKHENSKITKIFYNPSVNILYRFTKEELKNITKDENMHAKKILVNVNSKDIYLSLSELCQLVLDNRLCEKDVVKNADLYFKNETVLRILAAALSNNDALCIDKVPEREDNSNFISPSRDFAVALSKNAALIELDVDSKLSAEKQTFRTVVF